MSGTASFNDWVEDRTLHTIGTNHGSKSIPFQSWQKFKEAFAPELISRAIEETEIEVSRLFDPFGGSGTSALAAQFCGVHPITAEVNPYLADVIEAKLTKYDVNTLTKDISELQNSLPRLVKESEKEVATVNARWLPPTFVEPGINDRWIFSSQTARLLSAVLEETMKFDSPRNRRLIRVIVGGTLVGLSNIRVSGKGRRYRSNWPQAQKTPLDAAKAIDFALRAALEDINAYNNRRNHTYELLRGDSRNTITGLSNIDLSIFSPPYPNSFDYTDVYNVELWMLGYLSDMEQNRSLRSSTLSSHVQIKRDFSPKPEGSVTLDDTLSQLSSKRDALWSAHIPDMIGGYFADMVGVLEDLHSCLNSNGEVWMVVGDSRYAGIDVPVADILAELATTSSYSLIKSEPFRSMRSSPQQGGRLELPESLLVLRKTG